jgi:hypothetical protein
MRMNSLGIAAGGERRLREAIEAQVRREHEEELAAATGHWEKAAVEAKIRREIKERLKRLASPHSLWSAP